MIDDESGPDLREEIGRLVAIYVANCDENGTVPTDEDLAKVGELAMAARLENYMLDMVLEGDMGIVLQEGSLAFTTTPKGMREAEERSHAQ